MLIFFPFLSCNVEWPRSYFCFTFAFGKHCPGSNDFTSAVPSLKIAMKILSIFPRLKHLQVSRSVPVINSVFTLLHHLRKPLWMCTKKQKKVKELKAQKCSQYRFRALFFPERYWVRLLILVNGEYFYFLHLKAEQSSEWKQYLPYASFCADCWRCCGVLTFRLY